MYRGFGIGPHHNYIYQLIEFKENMPLTLSRIDAVFMFVRCVRCKKNPRDKLNYHWYVAKKIANKEKRNSLRWISSAIISWQNYSIWNYWSLAYTPPRPTHFPNRRKKNIFKWFFFVLTHLHRFITLYLSSATEKKKRNEKKDCICRCLAYSLFTHTHTIKYKHSNERTQFEKKNISLSPLIILVILASRSHQHPIRSESPGSHRVSRRNW